jgi:hypothetical protein
MENETKRLRISRKLAEDLERVFEGGSIEENIEWMLNRYQVAIGDPAACASTELQIKLDRVEEAAALLALANVELADVYRRLVGAELTLVRDASVNLSDLAFRTVQAKQGL